MAVETLSAGLTQLNAASATYKVPVGILLGVYGMETDFGTNVKTSSGGAVGSMQFLPSTAKTYNYPLTNSPSSAQLGQQFNAAAHYLSDLYKQYGSWDTALQHYSGGGYGLAQVEAKAETAIGTAGVAKYFGGVGGTAIPGLSSVTVPGASAITSGVNSAVGAVTSTAGALGSIASLLTSTTFWIRVGECILGALLLVLGLRALTGGDGNPVSVAQTAVKRVR